MKDVLITGANRTPMGGFQGALSDVPTAELGGVAIRAALQGATPDDLQKSRNNSHQASLGRVEPSQSPRKGLFIGTRSE